MSVEVIGRVRGGAAGAVKQGDDAPAASPRAADGAAPPDAAPLSPFVAAMLVAPVAAATQLAHSFRETLYLSILFGQVAVIGGFVLSISQSLPTGGSIVVVAIACYLLAIFASSLLISSDSVPRALAAPCPSRPESKPTARSAAG